MSAAFIGMGTVFILVLNSKFDKIVMSDGRPNLFLFLQNNSLEMIYSKTVAETNVELSRLPSFSSRSCSCLDSQFSLQPQRLEDGLAHTAKAAPNWPPTGQLSSVKKGSGEPTPPHRRPPLATRRRQRGGGLSQPVQAKERELTPVCSETPRHTGLIIIGLHTLV